MNGQIVNVAGMLTDPTAYRPSAGNVLRQNFSQTGSFMGGQGQVPLFVQMINAGYTPDAIAKALLAVDPSLRLNEQGIVKDTTMFGDPYQNAMERVMGQLNTWEKDAPQRAAREQNQTAINTAYTNWQQAKAQSGPQSSQAWQAGQEYWKARQGGLKGPRFAPQRPQMPPRGMMTPTQPVSAPQPTATMQSTIQSLQQPQQLRALGMFNANNMPQRW